MSELNTSACPAHQPYGLSEFIASILCQSRLSKSVFVYALLYTQRFTEVRTALLERGACGTHSVDALPSCPHCIFLGTLMIAFKFTNDNCYKIKYWAEWAKLTRSEITRLEIAILTALNYECVVPQHDFDQWAQIYTARAARPESTSLYAAILLYVQAIRRYHRATVALAEQRAAIIQSASVAVDVHTKCQYLDHFSGVARTNSLKLACPTRTPSPTSLGVVTPPATPACVVPCSSDSLLVAAQYQHQFVPDSTNLHQQHHYGSNSQYDTPTHHVVYHTKAPYATKASLSRQSSTPSLLRQASVVSASSTASSCYSVPAVDSGCPSAQYPTPAAPLPSEVNHSDQYHQQWIPAPLPVQQQQQTALTACRVPAQPHLYHTQQVLPFLPVASSAHMAPVVYMRPSVSAVESSSSKASLSYGHTLDMATSQPHYYPPHSNGAHAVLRHAPYRLPRPRPVLVAVAASAQ